MQDYGLFITHSVLLFACDMLLYCIMQYQITYAVLLYYCILLATKSNLGKISFVFFLLTVEKWFVHSHALLILPHIPLAYLVWYRHQNYLYFNTVLFFILVLGNVAIQLLTELLICPLSAYYYLYYKIGSIIIGALYGIYALHVYNSKTNKRQRR